MAHSSSAHTALGSMEASAIVASLVLTADPAIRLAACMLRHEQCDCVCTSFGHFGSGMRQVPGLISVDDEDHARTAANVQ